MLSYLYRTHPGPQQTEGERLPAVFFQMKCEVNLYEEPCHPVRRRAGPVFVQLRHTRPTVRQPARPAANTQPPRRASHVVRSVEIPDFSEDFFKKYDDPAYVERRLKELEEKQNKG